MLIFHTKSVTTAIAAIISRDQIKQLLFKCRVKCLMFHDVPHFFIKNSGK